MSTHPLAGKPAPKSILANIPRLMSAYYTLTPDPANPDQAVAFGTSGHRGVSTKGTFNEHHILAISQAIADYRGANGIHGPLFLGMDTHALSEADSQALAAAAAVHAAAQLLRSGGHGQASTGEAAAVSPWRRLAHWRRA